MYLAPSTFTLGNHHTIVSRTCSSFQTEAPHPLNTNSPLSPPQALETTLLLSVSKNLTTLETSVLFSFDGHIFFCGSHHFFLLSFHFSQMVSVLTVEAVSKVTVRGAQEAGIQMEGYLCSVSVWNHTAVGWPVSAEPQPLEQRGILPATRSGEHSEKSESR